MRERASVEKPAGRHPSVASRRAVRGRQCIGATVQVDATGAGRNLRAID